MTAHGRTAAALALAAFFWGAAPLAAQRLSPVRLYGLRCEHLESPVGIGKPAPRLSWKLRSDRTGEVQTAYEIRAASTRAGLDAGRFDFWKSAKVVSDQSVLVPWGGRALDSRAEVSWQVRVWDKDGDPSAWSDAASFELGLLHPEREWKGKWITADLPRHDPLAAALAKSSWITAGSPANEAAAARHAFELPADAVVRRATVDAVADGRLTIHVNGQAFRQVEGIPQDASPVKWARLKPTSW